MKRVELYARVRHAVMMVGLSQREASRLFGIDPCTVKKMLSYSVPPGYLRAKPPVRPKLDPFIGIIDRIVEEDTERFRGDENGCGVAFELSSVETLFDFPVRSTESLRLASRVDLNASLGILSHDIAGADNAVCFTVYERRKDYTREGVAT